MHKIFQCRIKYFSTGKKPQYRREKKYIVQDKNFKAKLNTSVKDKTAQCRIQSSVKDKTNPLMIHNSVKEKHISSG